MPAIGTKSVLNGKPVRWSGENYGWQSFGSHDKLKREGKFKLGAQLLDRLGNAIQNSPVTKNLLQAQQQFRNATKFVEPVENIVNRGVKADDKLPGSRVAQGGAVLAGRAANAANVDPRLALLPALLTGAVSIGSRAVIRKPTPAPIPSTTVQKPPSIKVGKKPAPIPNLSTQVSTDPVERLLLEREQDYQGALQVFRNDVLEREAGLNGLKGIGAADEVADEALAGLVSTTRRARRDAVSERSHLFEDDLRNYAIGNDKRPVETINKTETKQRQISQPIPGTQAHHPASVSSTEALVQNMNEHEVRKLWDIAAENGYPVGSLAENFIPLSGPAHVTGGKNWGPDFAHVGKDGKTPDPGRFKTEALPKGTTAEEAWKYLQPVLEEQRVLNERAYNHPVETRMRADAEQVVGRPIEWRGPVTPSRAASNKEAKSKGVNATTITKTYDRNPGLLKTKEIPNVTVAVPGGGRVPRDLGKPDKPQRIPRREKDVKP
jgi:hypothetical protein